MPDSFLYFPRKYLDKSLPKFHTQIRAQSRGCIPSAISKNYIGHLYGKGSCRTRHQGHPALNITFNWVVHGMRSPVIFCYRPWSREYDLPEISLIGLATCHRYSHLVGVHHRESLSSPMVLQTLPYTTEQVGHPPAPSSTYFSTLWPFSSLLCAPSCRIDNSICPLLCSLAKINR